MATYTQGTGQPGNGPAAGGAIDLTDTNVLGENFETFGCKVSATNLNTPDYMTDANSVYFERKVFDSTRKMADGVSIDFWGFEDLIRSKGLRLYPGPLMRLQEGQLAHVKLKSRKGPHTIHHHGIEPTTMNDGVGHVSFDVNSEYTYQWRPKHPGTWFYHCHRNTVLHFQMGLYGLCIVDPLDGWGYAYNGADRHRYDIEAMWVAEGWDQRWHNTIGQEHNAGLCGEDVGLNMYRPRYFMVTGVEKNQTTLDGRVAIRARKGQRVLIRLLNASYSVLGVKIDGIPVECVSIDGHALAGSDRPWCKPYSFAAGEEIRSTTAMRHELWFDTSKLAPGTYPVTFSYYDWIKKQIFNPGQGFYEGKAQTTITIT